MTRLTKLAFGAAMTLALAANAQASDHDFSALEGALRIDVHSCSVAGLNAGMPSDAVSASVAISEWASARPAIVADATANMRAANASAAKNKDGGKNGRGIALGQQDTSAQLVYLKFGSDNPTFNVFSGGVPFAGGVFPDYQYTQADRDFIQARMEADYALYDFTFTQEEPSDGPFSTIRIGDNDANPIDLAGGILFGRADNIDFGNNTRDDNAFADASFWQLLAELDANFGTQFLSDFLGLPPLDADGIEAVRQIAVVNQSANTSSHELGHILGLRHHDSFGAPGDGLPPARDPGEFIPVGELDQNALETLNHIMASGASAGLSIDSPVIVDRFFSERSATKLAINERTRSITETAAKGRFTLNKVVGGNPLESGENAGGGLDIRAALVEGSIDSLDDVDGYVFRGTGGDIFNAEIISTSDVTNDAPFLSRLRLFSLGKKGARTEIAASQLTFEGREPLIFDFTLPASGRYELVVDGPDAVPLSDGSFVELSTLGLNDLRLGDYEVLAYTVDGKPGN